MPSAQTLLRVILGIEVCCQEAAATLWASWMDKLELVGVQDQESPARAFLHLGALLCPIQSAPLADGSRPAAMRCTHPVLQTLSEYRASACWARAP